MYLRFVVAIYKITIYNEMHTLHLQIYSYLPTHFSSSYRIRETNVQIGMPLYRLTFVWFRLRVDSIEKEPRYHRKHG